MQLDVHAPGWTPRSWRALPARHQPAYPDEEALEAVLDRLAALPPLITSWETGALKEQLAEAEAGRRFLLQGGDCAERFDECTAEVIAGRLKILLQMSLVLVYGLKTPVVRVGRFAGQYAKPRSSSRERLGGATLPSYRGDIINGPAFTPEARAPGPERMQEAYHPSPMTLNFVRALAEGGFADLHHPEYWAVDFMEHSPLAGEYRAMLGSIDDALRFMETVVERTPRSLHRAHFYASHEALLLPYEEALTRQVPHQQGVYNLATHLPWIGMRTAQVGQAHIEYARGLANPLGMKVGPEMAPEELLDLIRLLDPDDEPGRLTLIHRFGAGRIEDRLPPLVDAVQRAGRSVLWCCDPMHGNTEATAAGLKTRRFDSILSELDQAFTLHAALGSHLGGVHFELTGEDVTECIGGARGLDEHDLERAYKSHVDPRLNYEQALEMAFSIVRTCRRMKRGG